MMDGLDFNGSHGSGQKEKYSKLPHLFLGGSYLMLNAKTDVSLPLHNSDKTFRVSFYFSSSDTNEETASSF